MNGVSVTPQAVVQGLHEVYGQTVAQLHQRAAELQAANLALAAERDQYRERLLEVLGDREEELAGPQTIQGVFRQEGQPDQPITLTDVTDAVAPDHGQPYVPRGFADKE
jgi:hypothetical protein